MEMAGAQTGSAVRRQPKPSRQARDDAAETFKSLSSSNGTVPLVNRLHLNWQSVPAPKQAKLYTPSTNNKAPSAGASSNKRALSPLRPVSRAVPVRKLPQRTSAVESFDQKYAAEDPLMRYVLHVIQTGSPVRRSDIPRDKYARRRVRPEEDVLYLIHCESPPCGFRNVYWLTFADEGTVLRHDHESSFEYFTLGSQGFTRFKGDQGVEFADLAGWVDEKRAFDQMTNMKGLKRIQLMIFFFSWKRQAVQRRLHRVRERLVCSLFTCHPLAAQLLMNVRGVCIEIECEAECDYIEADTIYTLERLAHIHRERARTTRNTISNKIFELCAMIDDATRDIARYKEGQGGSYVITDHESFSRTLRLSSLRERMFTFLRLVDCHVAEAVYQHVTLVVRDLQVRICGELNSAQSAGVEERTGSLYGSELAETMAELAYLDRVVYTVQVRESDAPVVAVPGLYVSLRDDVNFEGDISSSAMHFVPAKVEVLELVHTIILKYCVAMDGLPRILMDKHFLHVLTPFVPSLRREFTDSLLKPSHLVLASFELELREMRAAVDLHFRRIGILQQEHLRCIRAIKVAERESPVETTKQESVSELSETDEEDSPLPELPDLSSSAAAYELAQKTWDRFVQYANNAAPMLQVGYLLLDQRSFVERLRGHVSKRVAEMDDALPVIYQRFLTSLLEDVDGRIEKVTKIPTNLAEANKWLAQVTSMMPTHPFRQRLDAKIANLARLRILVNERGLVSLEPEAQDTIRKLELTWESVIETLLLCLARVEERESEHRRSVQDVITKVDEYITSQLQNIIKTFEGLPIGCEEEDEKTSNISSRTQEDLVQQLEDLVVMDIERKNVVLQFEEYDREHRAILDMAPVQHTVWTASLSSGNSESLSAVSLTDKLTSELLLLYIITSLELRQWYESWKKLQDKWLGTPLNGVHPGTMINRIKQFRRRLGNASSRLSRLSSVLVQTLPLETISPSTEHYETEDKKECVSFTKKDLKLMKAFDCSIEEMLNCNRIFQAITGGAFSDARWATMNQLLNVQSGAAGGGHVTLRQMKEKCRADQLEAFLGVCDECIVEAKLHVKLEQARQRLARIEVRVVETNYSVRCERVPEALALLDDIAVDLKLCLFGQNPELHLCLELRAELERKTVICEHILAYQKHWRLRCEATKLHEVDEFFSKRFSGGGDFMPRARKAQHKTGLKQEQSVWQLFLDASHAWSDHLRRLFFVRPQQAKVEQLKGNSRSLLGRKSAVTTTNSLTVSRRLSTATKSMDCTLDDVMESFKDFDFEASFAACERGMELVRSYLESLREKTPRLYCLDETTMLSVLLRDSDLEQLHQALAVCFPRVHRFSIARAANRVGSTIEMFGSPESSSISPVRAKTDGTVVIVGLEGQGNAFALEKSGRFRLAVAKIGRVRFWFTRLEEEMASMVLTDLKRAFEWVTQDWETSDFDSLLPQSIATALGLRFTFDMNCALQDGALSQLHPLRDTLRGRLAYLVATRCTDKPSRSVRLETMILLSAKQLEVVSHVINLMDQEQQEEALFFWNMQFQTRVFIEIILPGPNVQTSAGKHGKVERSELFPVNGNFLKDSASFHAGQATNIIVSCQVAHLQMPLGQEFIGWGRPSLLSPFTQRCSYALFSALRMHHTALVVPFSSGESGTDPTALLRGISEMLLRPCIEFSCDSTAGTTSSHQIRRLMNASSKLSGFLIVRHFLQLSAALVGVVREQMLQHFHQVAPVGMNSLVLPRYPGGFTYGASAVFIPLESKEELHQSGLVQSVRTQFRAVAVARPSIKYVVECVLLADGFTAEQIRELNVVEAVEMIERETVSCVFETELMVFRVVQEMRRLRAQYRVVWGLNPSTRRGTTKALLQSRQGSTVGSASEREMRDAQCVFHQAFLSIIAAHLNDEEQRRLDTLLARSFPLSSGGKLVTKGKGEEEAVAAAVAIYLESMYALPRDCEQFELILELWRALQMFPAALVYGAPGSGKTTCITALHRALVALELSEQSQEDEQMGSRNSLSPALTQLVILNPHLLTLDQFYSSVAIACGAEVSSSLKWVLVDGEVDDGVLDRLLEGDHRAFPSASTLPSSATLFRGLSGSVMSADCSDMISSTRLLFEVTSLENLSPSALRRCWALHIPGRCISAASIVNGWRTRWETQLVFDPASRGFEAMTAVFKTVDALLLRICVHFVVDEATPDRNDGGVSTVGLKLGFLSLNHATQTALMMVSTCCLQNKSLLQELSYLRLVELVAFAVLWGFSGHLAGPVRLKLENYVRAKSKEFCETRHLAELPRSLVDAGHFDDVWDELQPRFTTTFTAQPSMGATRGVPAEAKSESAFDTSSGQILVLVPAAASLMRICTLFLHSSHSFLLVGPTASGKTSLLRWLMLRNRESEAEEMKVETSLDERHVHGILDWTRAPAAWFRPLKQSESGISSRAKMREDADLFAGRSRHSFVFLDDLDVSGEGANKTQIQCVRTMLDHHIGYSTKHGGFQPVEKNIGAGMSLNDAGCSLPPVLDRFLRHFVVFRVPTYTQKELLGVFRMKFQPHFQPELSGGSTERRLSVNGIGNGGQLPLEEVILRASVDFGVEIAAFQQLEHANSCLKLFSLHNVNTLLERTLVFASEMNEGSTLAEGTTLVQLGKAHQSWLSELQNIFLSNCLTEDIDTKATGGEAGEDSQKKLAGLVRHLSEKYFSVAFRGSDRSFPISVEALHFLVKLTEHHTQAPLLQPRLAQLRDLLNEHMTAANGVSRRSSDQMRATANGVNALTSPSELMSSVLLEIAATSTSSGAGHDKTRPYSSGQLSAIEMKLLLSSSWCLTQATHLIHALSQQQQIIVSSSQHGGLVAEKLLRFACDLHGFIVHVVDDATNDQEQALRLVLSHAGIRQERVALWIREHQVTSCLVDLLLELCLGKFPSLALLAGGGELRDALVLSCIQTRKQLEIVTETELMVEFQQRLQQNFRLCILLEENVNGNGEEFVHWMKTRPSCHWRRLDLTELELKRLIPELARAALTSPALCGAAWEQQTLAKYVLLCQNVHIHMMQTSPERADPASQLEYILSFMTNVTDTYKTSVDCRQKKIVRLETGLETLMFARDKVVPTLERLKQTLERQNAHIDEELERIQVQQEVESPTDAQEMEEDRWVLRSKYEELLLMNSETKLRLEDVSRFLMEWTHVAERMNDLFTKWTQELSQERGRTDQGIIGATLYASAQRVYPHVTSLSKTKQRTCMNLLKDLLLDNIGDDCSLDIDNHLADNSEDDINGLVRLIWTSRFLFLSNPEIYDTVRMADDLSDRVPVFVDPSGVFQRFLVHIFSGHTLFSVLSGCGGSGEVESESLNTLKESMVISCDDPKLENYMQEAVRLGAPVLLVNFRSTDAALLTRLQPFLDFLRLSHVLPRRPMMQELTRRYYEDQRRQKQRRTSAASSTMTALVQTAVTVGVSTAKRARAARQKSMTLDPFSVAADVAKLAERRDVRGKPQATTCSELSFQIYAVTATPVPLETQHAVASRFAHFTVPMANSDLETLFTLPYVGITQQGLLQELRSEQIAVADCWMKRIQAQRHLEQLLETLKPVVERDDSPFATRRSDQVTIQLQERHSELALQFSSEHQADLIWSSREQNLRTKNDQSALAAEDFAPIASDLVGVFKCMVTMTSLVIGMRASPFYLQNVRYLENATAQQLAAQGDDSVQLSADGMAALLARISSGFVSRSHRQIFSFLKSIQRQIRDGEASSWTDALVWLVASHVRRSRVKESSHNPLNVNDKRQELGRLNSLKWFGDQGVSLVERLRRRVKLCAYLFNGWKDSGGSKNPRAKLKALRPQATVKSSPLDKITDSDSAENKEEALAEVQQGLDKLLAEFETLWYEWKTTRVRLQMDVEHFLTDLGFQDIPIPNFVERNNAFPSAITLLSLDGISARFKTQTTNETTDQQYDLLSLLLAKVLFPFSFAETLDLYLQRYSRSPQEDDIAWTSWPSPTSLVVDISPPRGKHSRAHLPRAIIMYSPDERSTLELELSTWSVAVFVDSATLREELVMLITTKHKFVLELLDPGLAESAFSLVSQLINEHALLSIPEWYVLASFSVATRIESGKLSVMDRIVVLSKSQFVLNRDQGRSIEQVVRRKLVEECGVSESVASALVQDVINGRRNSKDEVASSVVRDLEDLVLHLSSSEETGEIERAQMTDRLRQQLAPDDHSSASSSCDTSTAKLSSELLSDFLSIADASLAMLTKGEEEEWLSRHPADAWTCERLWTSFSHVRALFTALQALPDDGAPFFPWQSIAMELSSQMAAFDAVECHLKRLRMPLMTADSHAFNRQQQLSTLARGCVPFDWAQSFFAGTAWPLDASGTVSIAQLLLLIACRIGVLVRCIRGDCAWAINLAVASDACTFLRCLRSYTASRAEVSESSLVLVLELDAPDEEDEKKKQTLVIAKQLGACTDGHGAVLHHLEAGCQAWGVRVEGLVLVSTTKLYPLPMCRIMCQLSVDSSLSDVPVVLLPSLSPYQLLPTLPREVDAVRVLLGQTLNAVVDFGENSSGRESVIAVGIPVFPDDDSIGNY